MFQLLLLNFICPFVMVLVGAILKRHPVSDMRTQNGYNTPVSRKSQAHWDYAQQVAPDIFISLGKRLFLLELLASAGLFVLQVPAQQGVLAGACIGVGFLFFGFYRTDSKIAANCSGKQG